MNTETDTWTNYKKLSFKFCFAWVLLFIFSVPFPHNFIPDAAQYTSSFFDLPVKWLAINMLHLKQPYTTELISDSTGLYIHSLLLCAYALVITIIWSVVDKNKKSYVVLLYFFTVLIRYYLALQLFTYGFSKILKWQFYLPEPNTLFTTIGNTPKDLLYWSTMGMSRSYSMFAGTAEVIAASLLLFRRTTTAGALLGLGILINVVAINFGFDISVKLYSCFLCLLCLILIAANAKCLFIFLILQKQATLNSYNIIWRGKKKKMYIFFKLITVLLLLTDPLYQYLKQNNFNDDAAKRPLLHGAYTVTNFMINGDTVQPNLSNSFYWRRVFIHRQGYFITQFMNDEMQDYQLQYDTINKYLVLKDYEHHNAERELHYEFERDGKLILKGIWQKDSLQVELQAIDLKKMPLFKNSFNWTIDAND